MSKIIANKKSRFITFKGDDIESTAFLQALGSIHLSLDTKYNLSLGEGLFDDWFSEFREKCRIPIRIFLKYPELIISNFISESCEESGINFEYSSSLYNFLKKELRRVHREEIPFPFSSVDSSISLFARCAIGTILFCIKDFKSANKKDILFEKGKRYTVISSNDEIQKVGISTTSVQPGITVDYSDKNKIYDWSILDEDIEIYFTDTTDPIKLDIESFDINNKNIYQNYYNRIKDLPIHDFNKKDAALHAMRRSSLDGKLMRLGKTSTAIAVAIARDCKKIGVAASNNVRLAWQREFKRMKITDYVMVNKLSDLEKPGRFYLISTSWLKKNKDKEYKKRNKSLGKLNNEFTKKISIYRYAYEYTYTNTEFNFIDYKTCPKCNSYLVKNSELIEDPDLITKSGTKYSYLGGYKCITPNCGYINYEFLNHKDCEVRNDFYVRDRYCKKCNTADSEWQDSISKRLKKKFSMFIIDEAHNAKDITTDTAQSLFKIKSKYKLCLTGTPISKSVMDCYYILEWLFGRNSYHFPFAGTEGYKKFSERFCQHISVVVPSGKIDKNTGKELMNSSKRRIPYLNNPADFWSFIAPKILRRNYDDPEYIESITKSGLKKPNAILKTVPCEMTYNQKLLTIEALENFKDKFNVLIDQTEKSGGVLNSSTVMSQMALLIKLATCPEKINEKDNILYDGPNGGGKAEIIKLICEQHINKGQKVLILSTFNNMQLTCEELLKEYNPIRFDNQNWDDTEKSEAIELFENDPKHKVFIGGTRGLREGLDFSAADVCICTDLLWAPAFQVQAYSRILAPTSKVRNCIIYFLLSKNSVDHHVYSTFYSRFVSSQQALDRKVIDRRSEIIDIKEFVNRVLHEKNELLLDSREMTPSTITIPASLDNILMEERNL